MPEYLAPGVYVEEVSFRSKSIEGVPTSTTGFAGVTRYGPVQYVDGTRPGPNSTEPRLITSFTEFERVYGGLEPVGVDRGDGQPASECYLAHAARAFFLNGGQRLYVSRVFAPRDPGGGGALDFGIAAEQVSFGAADDGDLAGPLARRVRQRAADRAAGAQAQQRRPATPTFGTQATGLTRGAVVEILEPPVAPASLPGDTDDLDAANLAVVDLDETALDANGRPQQVFVGAGGPVATTATSVIKEVLLRVTVQPAPDRIDVYDDLGAHPAQRRWIGKILQANDPEDENAVALAGHRGARRPGRPGDADPRDRADRGAADRHHRHPADRRPRRRDAQPGRPARRGRRPRRRHGQGDRPRTRSARSTTSPSSRCPTAAPTTTSTSCEAAAGRPRSPTPRTLRYRIAVVDAPRGSSMTEIRDVPRPVRQHQGRPLPPLDRDPRPAAAPGPGRAAARGSCCRRPASSPASTPAPTSSAGVYKAPANEVVRGLTRFEANINKARQDVLNPEGINALRFFEGRGNRVWGARTMTSDPEWKYVNVRRLFIYLEHSIDKATQWAVFEPNNERLWDERSGSTVEDFLLRAVEVRRAARREARGGVLRPLRPHHDDPERPRQRPADLPDRRRADQAGRVRDLPDRPVDGRRAADLRRATHGRAVATTPTARSTSSSRSAGTRAPATRASIVGGFSDVSGLGFEVSYSEYRNGNEKVNTVRKVPNTFKNDDVTLKRGLVGLDRPVRLAQGRARGHASTRERDDHAARRGPQPGRHLEAAVNAQPKKWTGPTLAAKGGSEVAMEELISVHEGIEYA